MGMVDTPEHIGKSLAKLVLANTLLSAVTCGLAIYSTLCLIEKYVEWQDRRHQAHLSMRRHTRFASLQSSHDFRPIDGLNKPLSAHLSREGSFESMLGECRGRLGHVELETEDDPGRGAKEDSFRH